MEWLHALITLFDFRPILILALIFIPLERLFALHPGQPIVRRFFWTDIVYIVFNRIPIWLGLIWVTFGLMMVTTYLIPSSLRNYVEKRSLWIQVPAMLVLADIGFYTAHRLFHAVPTLWRFHAVHHSIEEMDWMVASRIHPVDMIVTKSFSLIPQLLLGFSSEALAIHGTIYLVHTYLLHSNLRIKFGPLRWLLASPEFHHWHHCNQREAWNKNFGGQLSILDVLFGTLYMPAGQMPAVYGVDDPVPHTYLEQCVYPFQIAQPVAPEAVTSSAHLNP